jgi:hypothetical protein
VAAKRIFDSVLSTSFEPSEPFLIGGDKVTLDWAIEVTGAEDATARVEWYLEFTSADPNDAATLWYREPAEQNSVGTGDVAMPKVVRRWQENDGTDLAVGTHHLSAQMSRSHDFCRVQARVATGDASAQIDSVFGADAVSPVSA